MQKLPWRRPWICSRCIRAQRRQQSTAAVAATTLATPEYPVTHRDNLPRKNDRTLKELFDRQGAWQDFSGTAKSSTGLIGNRHLTSPRGFQRFAELSLSKCRRIVEKTLSAKTIEEYVAVPKDLDRLSDLLCRVIDLSEFIRTIHPDQAYSAAATSSHSSMFQYMNELNTTTGLNDKLKEAFAIPEVVSRWTAEEKIAAQILMKDFAKSGIDLPERQRHDFVEISNQINQVGTQFINEMEHARDHVTVSKSELQGIDPTIAQNLGRWNSSSVMLHSPVSRSISSTAYSDSARRRLYVAERTASKKTTRNLESLLLRRAQLAKLTGFSSFAQMTLVDKMAKTPEAVTRFLQSLSANNRPQTQQELARFLEVKQSFIPDAHDVKPWDHAILFNRALSLQQHRSGRPRSRLADEIKNYLSVGNVMEGLSSLFHRLYGVRLVPCETKIGEVWHPDVRRLDVHDENDQHIATVYCDLFARGDKLPNPAHFTLVCSRQVDKSEMDESQAQGEPLNDGLAVGFNQNARTGELMACQLPVIALVCDFPHTSGPTPSLLSPHSVVTLFHEMGHAIHSILGQTSMQGISGTRCATDFAELPSILMEYFATDAEVLSLFARHWQTDEPIPAELLGEMKRDSADRAALNAGWHNQTQILMALEDQLYHSSEVVDALSQRKFDTTAAFHRIWDRYGMLEEPPETSQQGFFGHLYGYGATYYAYLFDRAIARQVWRAVFRDGAQAGAIDRAAGERFKNEVLKWGGGRDPWKCLEGLMGNGKGILAEGGELAMGEVGRWGVGAAAEGAM